MSLFRIEPSGPPGAYKTFTIRQAPDQLVRSACEQVGCEAWARGWDTTVDEATDLGRTQAAYIRQRSGRDFRELKSIEGITIFRFEPGQRCFAEHRTRPQTFGVLAGDWRQNLGLIRRHSSGADWVEDFGEHQDRIADQQRRG